MLGNISSIALSLPKQKTSIKDICLKKNWNYTKILDKTGIKTVYKSNANETALSMAFKAAKKIKFKKSEIDALIYVTQSPDFLLPTNACLIQNQIKLNKDIMAFDINQGCSGYIYGLYVAQKLLNEKSKSKVLLICSDTYTKNINENDKTCSTIFSDGATVSLINNKSKNNNFVFYTDGSGAKDLILNNSGQNSSLKKSPELFMDGRKVLFFTMNVIPKLVKKLLNKDKLKINEIKYFVFHQASKIVIDNLTRILEIPQKKVYRNYSRYGNTVSSTIPICLNEMIKKKLIKRNDKILLCGFGVGLSAAATIIKA